MKAIMSTAVDDGILGWNPCRVRGAGQDRSPERPVLSVGEVVALVEAVPERYRALVLLAAFGSLRWGELAALRRCDIDSAHGTVRVERSLTELSGGYLVGPPKSAAGKRVVVIPAVIRPALADHLATFTASQPDALVFTSSNGAPCEMATSGAGYGAPRWPRRACPRRTFTIFAILATRSRR
jgi:integrase